MRVDAETKERTRVRILATAERLFAERGYEATSTRALASAASIGVGTLFNYFASKEVLALTLIDDALSRGETRYRQRRRADVGLDEALFDHIAAGLRELEPYRGFLGEVLESVIGPFARPGGSDLGERIRTRHLETVGEILREQGGIAGNEFATHLYWTLYLGVLGAWARDRSPGGQDAWVILDQSMHLFSATITSDRPARTPREGEPRAPAPEECPTDQEVPDGR